MEEDPNGGVRHVQAFAFRARLLCCLLRSWVPDILHWNNEPSITTSAFLPQLMHRRPATSRHPTIRAADLS